MQKTHIIQFGYIWKETCKKVTKKGKKALFQMIKTRKYKTFV